MDKIDYKDAFVEDRGFQFGDGLYEVIHVYDGKFFFLDRHSSLKATEIYLNLDLV